MCVFVFGCLHHCVYLFAVDDFVSQGVSELVALAPEMDACILERILAVWGMCGDGFVCLCFSGCVCQCQCG